MAEARFNIPLTAGKNFPDWIRKCATIVNNHMRYYRDKGVVKLTVDNTAVGNIGSGEDALISYSLGADTLAVNGNGIRITAWGSAPNNASTKTLKLYFGTAIILNASLATSQVDAWRVTATVWRTGASTQDYESLFLEYGTSSQSELAHGTATQDDTAVIIVKCTGEGVSNNDIVQEGLLIEFLP